MVFKRISEWSSSTSFTTGAGCDEWYLVIRTPPATEFTTAMRILESEYISALGDRGFSDETAVFSRLFVSDLVNQKQRINTSALSARIGKGVLSIIEQKPVGGGPVMLFSYHLRNFRRAGVASFGENHVSGPENGYVSSRHFHGENYTLLFTANNSAAGPFDAYRQTDAVFSDLNRIIERQKMSLLGNTIRTWIYVQDIDNHYQGMVRARREYFSAQGLTNDTRYLASTGIEGGSFSPERLVTIDSLSIGGLAADQIIRMHAPSHMSPTIRYGVTFERGLRVRFGDRSHLHVSGTASIDQQGEVLHTGDVAGQTRRTVENLKALLSEQGAAISDMAYLICYVRNFHEWSIVERELLTAIGDTVPLLPVMAKVCRPAWLLELEGVGIIPDRSEYAPFR